MPRADPFSGKVLHSARRTAPDAKGAVVESDPPTNRARIEARLDKEVVMVERGRELSGRRGKVSRRAFLKSGGVAGLASAAGALHVNVARAQSRTLKIGFIGAQSGVRANFGETTPWMIERIRTAVKDGLKVGGKSYAIEIVVKDNQSDPNRSSVVGSELVLREKCDLVIAFDSDAALAVGELADARSMPTISTMVPWTGWKFSRGATPDDLLEKSFPYTFHFFWGASEVVKNFLAMWNSVRTNKIVGTFYVDNPTGKAFANPKTGLPGGMVQHGYREVTGGFFKMATDDFTNQASAFKNAVQRSSQASSCQATGSHSGIKPRRPATGPRSARWPRPFCSPARLLRWGRAGMACRPRSGGRRSFRTHPRSL